MFPKQQIDGFEKYWRRRKPGSSTALHYASDVRIFFKWAEGKSPEAITVHDVDEFIGWQQDLGRAQVHKTVQAAQLNAPWRTPKRRMSHTVSVQAAHF